jgi:hypothetical protein
MENLNYFYDLYFRLTRTNPSLRPACQEILSNHRSHYFDTSKLSEIFFSCKYYGKTLSNKIIEGILKRNRVLKGKFKSKSNSKKKKDLLQNFVFEKANEKKFEEISTLTARNLIK